MSLLLLALACNDATAPAPAAPQAAPRSSTVLLINNSSGTWEDLGVFVDGRPACNVEALPPHGSVSVVDGACEVNAGEAPEEPAPAEPEEPGKEVAASNPPASKPRPKPRALRATASISGGIGPARTVRVFNATNIDWHDCTFTLNGRWRHHQGFLAAQDADVTPVIKYRDADGNFPTRNIQVHRVHVRCREGETTTQP